MPPSKLKFVPLAGVVVLVLLCISLASVWAIPYLPLQDYPQHLFQAKLTAESLAGHPLDNSAYQVQLKPTYSVFYLLVWAFHGLLALSDAGRASVALYFILIAWACWRTLWHTARGGIPGWGALFLFPIAFNQIYFLGFINFLLAMPLLWVMLLWLLEHRQQPWNLRSLLIHVGTLLVLLFIHPFAVIIGAMVIAAWVALGIRVPAQRRYFLIALAIAAIVIAGWLVCSHTSPTGAMTASRVVWDSPLRNASFMLELFTGMSAPTSPHPLTLLFWLASAAILLWAAFTSPRIPAARLVAPFALAAILLLALAVLFLPFSAGGVGYVNVRITMIFYFFLALLAAHISLRPPQRTLLFLAIAGLVLQSIYMQYRASQEVAEIQPIIAAMQPNAAVLPLLFDRESAEMDGYYFSLHLNDAFHYQIEKGGLSPYLFDPVNGQTPVSFCPGTQPPAPDIYLPTQFRWERFGPPLAPYRYYLVRGGSPSLYRYMDQHAILQMTSGKWRLYEAAPSAPVTAP
jgi:hypothetical protein